jgi:hypothetical protein
VVSTEDYREAKQATVPATARCTLAFKVYPATSLAVKVGVTSLLLGKMGHFMGYKMQKWT